MNNEARILINEDIYDSFGRIYIKKGKIVTLNKHNMDILRSLDLLDAVLKNTNRYKNDRDDIIDNNPKLIRNITKEFSDLYEIIDEEIFEMASEKVQKVMDNAKEMSWKIHLDTLANYIGYYYSHSINTALIASMIGIKLQYSEEKLKDLIIGALLHDIGFMLIPKEIIYRNDNLGKEEIKIKNKHCELGIAMLGDSDLSEISKSIIMQHHERMDGSGYPLGIQGRDITVEAQIVMVADCFDAESSEKIYKNELSLLKDILDEDKKYSKYIIRNFKSIVSLGY